MFNKFQKISTIGFIISGCIIAIVLLISSVGELINPSSGTDVEGLDLKNFSVETVTDEQIIEIGTQYEAFRYKTHRHGEKTGVDDSDYSDFDYDVLSFSSKKINGIQTVQASKVNGKTLNVKIETTLNSGEMKIAVIRDGEILEFLEVGKAHELNYFAEGEHTYYVKLICKNSNMSVSVSREIK